MPVKMQPTSVIKANLGIEPNGKVQKFFTQTCAIHMDKYVPFDTGILAGTVVKGNVTTSNVTDDQIIYDQEYAHYVYEGISKNGKPLVYHTDKHPYAGKHWDKRMVSAEMQDIVKEVQDFIDKGGK